MPFSNTFQYTYTNTNIFQYTYKDIHPDANRNWHWNTKSNRDAF